MSSGRYFPHDRVRPKLWSHEVNNGAVLPLSLGRYFSWRLMIPSLFDALFAWFIHGYNSNYLKIK